MQLSTTKKNKINEKIDQFKQEMNASADSLKKAANHYYEALQIDAKARDMFSAQYPTVSSKTWSGFVKIATGELDSRLLFDATPGGKALTYCDTVTQKEYIENPIPVSCGNGDTILIQLDKMTSEQARQVFNRGAVRDIPEQRAWIETQKTRRKPRKGAGVPPPLLRSELRGAAGQKPPLLRSELREDAREIPPPLP